MIKLRPYQERAVEKLRQEYSAGRKSVLFVLPTGGGKTFVFSYMAKSATAKNNRVLILVHRRELLDQASRSLSSLGVDHGLIMPGEYGHASAVAVASVQTLERRLATSDMRFDFIIVDEAHHAVAATWAKILASFSGARILGVTATPARTNGQGLSTAFESMVHGPSISELIKEGFLVQPEVYAYHHEIDLSGVKKTGGDFDKKGLSERVDRATITGSAVEHYRRLSPNEPAIAFCASISHAQHVAEEFNAAGFRAVALHGGMGDNIRRQAIDDLASGRVDVLASVDLISEGTDIPVASTAILLRPTQSLALYLQQVGRVLRPAPGKLRGLILDHVGNCFRHGLPDDDQKWSLQGRASRAVIPDDSDVPTIRQCKSCFAVFESKSSCPYCGSVAETRPRNITFSKGELTRINREKIKKQKQEKMKAYRAAKSFQEVVELTARFGDKPGFAYQYWKHRKISRGE